jgi:hypothetical protein
MNTSLTAPHDRVATPRVSNQGVRLTEEQVSSAIEQNVDTEIIQKFPRVDKFYADPIHNNQVYCMHSFVPSKGAKPDEHGCFGFMKCRGTFQTDQEAAQRSEEIIRNIDSYHALQTAYVGRPFPICVDAKKFTKESVEIDIRKKTVEAMSENIKEKKQSEKQVVKEIKEREEKLLAESKEDFVEDPLERYTMLRTKKAQLSWTYAKTMEKVADMKKFILKTREEIAEMDAESPTYKEEYMEKYLKARRESGLDEQPASEENFLQYMGAEDIDIGF